MSDKPYAPSCDRNRDPILDVLREHFATARTVLELGSGTGQHAVYFGQAMPQWAWQTSERDAGALAGIRLWLDEAAQPNLPSPLRLDVRDAATWPARRFDAVFSANTLHYMPWDAVQALFANLPTVLVPAATVVVYGPFNVDGAYTSESNARFDEWLKARDPSFAIRDFEAVDALAAAQGLRLVERRAMPAHNFCLVWRAGTT